MGTFAGGWGCTRGILFALLVGGVGILVGCSGQKVATKSSPQVAQYRIKTIVVMPFAILETPQLMQSDSPESPVPDSVVKSDITISPGQDTERTHQQTAVVPAEAGMDVAKIFSRKLRRREGIEVRSPRDAELEMQQLRTAGDQLKPEEAGRRVALRLKADAAVVGLVRVYREREGSKYGAQPAAVGFEVKLVAADGRILWVGNYYENQKPVTGDFQGFLDRGLGYLTAEELTSYGAEQLIKQFPIGEKA
jgi:hypothetical protein